MTIRDALEAAAHAAAAGHPGAERRRNELLAYAAARGARIRTLAGIVGASSLESVHRWTGGTTLEREAILGDACPRELRPELPPAPIAGQDAMHIPDPVTTA